MLPWIGKTPPLTRSQWHVLGLLGTAELFDPYDLGILTLAPLQIQAGLGIAEDEVGALVSIVRLGVIPALLAIGFRLPETALLELEQIAAER